MSRFHECDGCGERLERDRITLSVGGHLTIPGSGLYLNGDYDFCGYACIERWARLRALGPKAASA